MAFISYSRDPFGVSTVTTSPTSLPIQERERGAVTESFPDLRSEEEKENDFNPKPPGVKLL